MRGDARVRRHPPPHLADGAARDLRRLDADRLLPRRAPHVLAPLHAEDVYAGNHVGALEALDAGVTTILDFSHCNNTPEHADARAAGPARRRHPRAVRLRLLPAAARRAAFHLARRCASRTRAASARATSPAHASDLVTMGVSLTEPGLIPFADTRPRSRRRASSACAWRPTPAASGACRRGLDQFARARPARPGHRPRALQRLLGRASWELLARLGRRRSPRARRPRCRWAWATRRSAARSTSG